MNTNKNKFLLLAMIATLVAVGLHIYLTQHFYGIKFGTATGESFCNINAVLNCDAVTASKFSSLFGVPIALWGAFTNLVLLYFIAVTRWNLVEDNEKTSRYAFLISGVTVLASIVMGLISATAMSHLCIFCMAAYAMSLIGFFGIWKGASDLSMQNLLEDIKDIFVTEKWVAGFLIAIPALSFLANLMYLESSGFADIQKAMTERVGYWQAAPVQNFDLSKGLALQKEQVEPIMTIVEFADFRCGHCKHAAPVLHKFTLSHPDVKLIYKSFPLDGTCNEAMQGGGDGISCGLAASVFCAEKLSQKGWAVHDFIFENQEEITMAQNLDKNLEAISNASGVALGDLKTCSKDPAIMQLISSMAKEGVAAQIRGTPTIFVNGKVLTGGQALPVLEAVYQELKK